MLEEPVATVGFGGVVDRGRTLEELVEPRIHVARALPGTAGPGLACLGTDQLSGSDEKGIKAFLDRMRAKRSVSL